MFHCSRSWILLVTLLIYDCSTDHVSSVPPPKEVLCVDSSCKERVVQGRLLQEVIVDGIMFAEHDALVDVVAKSAMSENSLVKIAHKGKFMYVDSTFVKELSAPDARNLRRFPNPDAHLSHANETPGIATPPPSTTALPVESRDTVDATVEQSHSTIQPPSQGPPPTEPVTATASAPVPITPASASNNMKPSTDATPATVMANAKIASADPSASAPSTPSNQPESSLPSVSTESVVVNKNNPEHSTKASAPPNPTHDVVQSPQNEENVPNNSGNSEEISSTLTNVSLSSVSPKNNVDDKVERPDSEQRDSPGEVQTSNMIGGNQPSQNTELKVDLPKQTKRQVPTETIPTQPPSVPHTSLESMKSAPITTPSPPTSDIGVVQQNTAQPAVASSTSDATPTKLPDTVTKTTPSSTDQKSDEKVSETVDHVASEKTTTEDVSLSSQSDSSTPDVGIAASLTTDRKPGSEKSGSDASEDPARLNVPTTTAATDTIDSVDFDIPSHSNKEHVEIENQEVDTPDVPVEILKEMEHKPSDEQSTPPSLESEQHRDPTSSNDHAVPPRADDVPVFESADVVLASNSVSDASSLNDLGTRMKHPEFPGLFQCIAWAANETRNPISLAGARSPLSRVVMQFVRHLLRTADTLLSRLPEPVRYSGDKLSTNLLALPLSFVLAWLLFALYLVGFWVLRKIVYHILGLGCSRDPTVSEYLKAKELISQLSSRLMDQEEANTQLTNWNAQLTAKLQNIQAEQNEKIEGLQELVDASHNELSSVRKQLTESLETCGNLEQELQTQVAAKEKFISELDAELKQRTSEHSALKEDWEAKVTELKATHQKTLDDAKREHEELYHQAVDYYNRMKAMQPEMDKLIEARKQAEDKVVSLQTELDSLRTTFTTLKSFELALEQETTALKKQKSTTSVEQSDYMLVEGSGESESALSDSDSTKQVRADPQSDNQEGDDDGAGEKAAQFGSSGQINGSGSELGVSSSPEPHESKLRASLALFLDVGRLQAELTAAQNQIKTEEARAQCEHELRVKLEEQVEQMERENSNLRSQCSQISEEKLAAQTRLEVLSGYFKERELELQRDLGKHVVVGSESSEALNNYRKRNKELEAELKALREQVNSMRRELGETERINRRQISELDKRSHENWLAARAADHQVKELRDENTSLRQKLLEAERALLPPALRAQQLNQVRPASTLGQLPSAAITRPNVRSSFTSSSSGRLEKRSLSGQSLTSISSHTSRPELPNLPFPLLPPPPPPPIPLSMPRNMSPGAAAGGGLQPPIPPFLPGLSPNRLPFPHGFPPPPPPPPPPPSLPPNQSHQSPSSSTAGSSSRGRPFT